MYGAFRIARRLRLYPGGSPCGLTCWITFAGENVTPSSSEYAYSIRSSDSGPDPAAANVRAYQVTMTRPVDVTAGCVAWLNVSSRFGTITVGGVHVRPPSIDRTSSSGVEPSEPKRVYVMYSSPVAWLTYSHSLSRKSPGSTTGTATEGGSQIGRSFGNVCVFATPCVAGFLRQRVSEMDSTFCGGAVPKRTRGTASETGAAGPGEIDGE